MLWHREIEGALTKLIRSGEIRFAGNATLKIYGKLNCSSGKWMKRENRVFFSDEAEAIRHGFRSCKRCMRNVKI
jgi:methylphosphotriester-DNA--protein-cysteine methyltransferase